VRTNLWDPPRLKIERAVHHIHDFNAKAAEFLSKKPFETVVRSQPTGAEDTICIQAKEAIPDEFALIIGDAVHNLRTALDLAIFGIIGTRAKNPESVQFPFGKNVYSFKNAFTQRQIDIAGENVRRAVCDLKPYDGGNEPLYGVHRLDIQDKHKLIFTFGKVVQMIGDDVRKLHPALSHWYGPGPIEFVDVKSGVLFRINYEGNTGKFIRTTGEVEKKTEFQPPFSICFAQDQPFGGSLVVPALRDMTREIEHAIGLLRAAAEADNSEDVPRHGQPTQDQG
jgi:hypothetical protein